MRLPWNPLSYDRMSVPAIPPEIQSAIENKVSGIVSLHLAWRQACAKALSAGCPAAELEGAIGAFESPRSLERLAQLSQRYGEPLDAFFKNLRQRVDDSSFGLLDWLGALEAVMIDLEDGKRAAPLSTIIGYAHCTAEFMASQRHGQSLRAVVEEMLDQYGFDG